MSLHGDRWYRQYLASVSRTRIDLPEYASRWQHGRDGDDFNDESARSHLEASRMKHQRAAFLTNPKWGDQERGITKQVISESLPSHL